MKSVKRLGTVFQKIIGQMKKVPAGDISLQLPLAKLHSYAAEHRDPALQQLIKDLEEVFPHPGNSISVGDVNNSTAVAVGNNIRIFVKKTTDLPQDLLTQLTVLADALSQRVGAIPPNAPYFFVPFPHNPDFVGRDAELQDLHKMLQQRQGPVGIRPTVLVGLGGIGKTQLAVEYAHAHRADYPAGIFWLNAINSFLLEFADLAEKLELADRDTPRDRAARKAWDYLNAHPKSLVIFDNVIEPSTLNVPFLPDLIPANLRCRTLFTTRQRDFPRMFQPFEVKVLPEDAAMRLLLRARPEVLEEHHSEWGWARIVCASLGWLPLALELAAAYLGTYPDVTITGYLERLRSEGKLETVDDTELHPEDLPTRHDIAVRATLQTQWTRLTDEGARLVFRAAGQFPEASWIPTARLGLLTGIEAEAKPGHPSPLARALQKLHNVSLVEELTDDRLRLHPLVQEFAIKLSPPGFRPEMAARVAAVLDDLRFLQARVIHYGIDMVLEDVRTGLEFCFSNHQSMAYVKLSRIDRLLDRQAHHLRGWDSAAYPAFFLQQLRNAALELDFQELQARAGAKLAQLGQPYLCKQFKVSRESPELVRTLVGHSGQVNSVALTPDGRVAVSASDDQTLKVWDITTGRELHTLTGHRSSVTSVALTPDGRVAVSASRDHTLKVWDVPTGRELRTLKGHRGWIHSVALTLDGRVAVSTSWDKTLKVWDITTGRELHTLTGHRDAVFSVALTSDGRVAVSASDDQTLKVWDITTGRELRTFKGHSREVRDVAVAPDGRVVVSASWDKTLKVWNIMGELLTFRGHSGTVNKVAFALDERVVVSASEDKTLKVWDIMTGRELHTLRGHSSVVESVALTPDGRVAVSASKDGTLKVWDMATGRELRTLTGHSGWVRSVVLTPDGRVAVSASKDHTLKVWDIITGRELPVLRGHSDRVTSATLTPDGHVAVSASWDHTLKVWDTTTGRELHTLRGHSSSVTSVALTPDGRLAVSASYDETLKVWDIPTGRELHTLTGHRGWVHSVALTPDGRVAVSASKDHTLKVWDILTGRELHTLTGHGGWVHSVVLTPDGRLAVSASNDQTLKVWDITTGRELHTYQHSDRVKSATLSADGRVVVSVALWNPTLRVWDIPTGRELHTLTGHSEEVNSVALTPDGRVAVSTSYDSTIRVWDTTTGRELHTLRGHSSVVETVALTPDGRVAVSASKDHTLKIWDILTGQMIANVPTVTSLSCCAITPNAKMILAGDESGVVHFFELVGWDTKAVQGQEKL